MNTKDLLQEAIADAKAVRETALAQAKLALEEAFTPRLQSMFSAKLQEMYDEDLDEAEEIDEAKHKMDMDEDKHGMAKEKMDEMADMESYDDDDNSIDEIDLDEILAELDAELEESKKADSINEAEEEEETEEESEEEIESEEDVEDEMEAGEEDEEEEKEVSELSMDELEELIRDIVSQEMGPGDEGEEMDMDMDMDVDVDAESPDTADDEVDLDEILAELLDEEKEEMDERKKYGGNKGDVPADKRGDKKDTAEEEGVEDYKKRMKEDLQLALEAVETLRQELQEVNLLNAKLLYVNKIFKDKHLNESQKLKVVKAFDKAESAKEAKLVYESLSETFNAKSGKSQIKESLGFASKAAGVAPAKQTIVESNEFISRMQKLANIK
jgi:hypothetical protein